MLRALLISIAMSWSTALAEDPRYKEIPDFDNTIEDGEDRQVIAFIGKAIAISELDYEQYCPADQACMFGVYLIRFEVRELIDGDFEGQTLDAISQFGSQPINSSLSAKNALIYIHQEDGELYHSLREYDEVHRLSDGTFAVCGDPYSRYYQSDIEDMGREDLEFFDFDPPVQEKLSDHLYDREEFEDDPDTIRDNFVYTMRKFAPPAWEIDGDIATCEMGMRPDDAYWVRMDYEFEPAREEYELREACKKEAGFPEDQNEVTAEQRRKFRDCFDG